MFAVSRKNSFKLKLKFKIIICNNPNFPLVKPFGPFCASKKRLKIIKIASSSHRQCLTVLYLSHGRGGGQSDQQDPDYRLSRGGHHHQESLGDRPGGPRLSGLLGQPGGRHHPPPLQSGGSRPGGSPVSGRLCPGRHTLPSR